jgi:thiamine kinase-like enzyme
MDFSVEECRRLLPELSGLSVDICELKGGITNRLYRVVSTQGHDYVLRIYGAKTEFFIDREVEMENLRRLEPTNVTPKLVKYLPEHRVTVVQFIPGTPLKNQDFLNPDLREKIVRPILAIHNSGVELPYTFNPLAEVKRMYSILQRMTAKYEEFRIQETIQMLEAIGEFSAVPTSQYVPCHNDLLAENFILTNGEGQGKEPMALIDLEYGGMAPAHYDLADMFQEILVPREVETALLGIY